MDKYTEQTTRGLGSRLLQSIKGVFVGLLLFVAAFPVLWFNEGYAVKMARSLTEGASEVVGVAADSVDPANEGKLVHVAGRATTEETITDPLFKVSANAIRLRRKVEMYQWRETSTTRTERNTGGSETTRTTYSYDRVWSEQPIDAGSFRHPEGHQNPPMPFGSADYTARRVTLGAFRLNASQVGQLSGADPVDISAAEPPESIRDRAQRSGSGFHAGNPGLPVLGDLRITFTQVSPGEASVVARQFGDTFEPYRAKAGGSIELVAMGTQSAQAMFDTAMTHNTVRTWILRAVGLALMLFGLMLILNPLATLADVVPIMGSLARAGTGAISFAVALCLSLVTIAAAWIAYRPLVAIGLLVAAALAAYAIGRFRKAAPAQARSAGAGG
jgi:hypothetical protein